MEDKSKLYEKIEFLGEGQVFIKCSCESKQLIRSFNCHSQVLSSFCFQISDAVFFQFWLFCLWNTSTLTISILSQRSFRYLCIVTIHLHCNKNALVMKLYFSFWESLFTWLVISFVTKMFHALRKWWIPSAEKYYSPLRLM